MDSNRDESERCIELAKNLIKSNEYQKALKYLIKAEKLFPSKQAKGLSIVSPNLSNNLSNNLSFN